LPYDGGKLIASVYKITNGITQILDVQDSGIPYVSPDGSKVAFYSGAAVYVYDIKTWKRIASLSGEKGDKEINEQIDNLTKLEDKLYEIMDSEGFIQQEQLEGPQGGENEGDLTVNNQVGQAASIADELSNPMNNIEPNEELANPQETGEMNA
jgi:hypothetical protein